MNCLPEKLSPVVKPLMESVRKEENELFQLKTAEHLCHLMSLILDRNPCPIPKIIQNLTAFLCSDGDFTPPIDDSPGILSLVHLNSGINYTPGNHEEETSKKSGGNKGEDPKVVEERKIIMIQRRGATSALQLIVEFFGVDLPVKVSKLWDLTFGVLQSFEFGG